MLFTKSQLLPWSQVMSRPPSLPIMMCFELRGSIHIACWSTCAGSPLPPASSSVAKVLPPSVDLAQGSPPTYSVFGFIGSTRSWLKYIGRELQLLTMRHDRPRSSERKIPPSDALSGATVPRPAPGAPLLHAGTFALSPGS